MECRSMALVAFALRALGFAAPGLGAQRLDAVGQVARQLDQQAHFFVVVPRGVRRVDAQRAECREFAA
jgi:hypothetical protein